MSELHADPTLTMIPRASRAARAALISIVIVSRSEEGRGREGRVTGEEREALPHLPESHHRPFHAAGHIGDARGWAVSIVIAGISAAALVGAYHLLARVLDGTGQGSPG